jgi:predicted GTPase
MTFDKVLTGTADQNDVYNAAGLDSMISNVVNGFHSTVFCYGQTGSGKSFTMDGLKYRKNEKNVFVPMTNQESTASPSTLFSDAVV